MGGCLSSESKEQRPRVESHPAVPLDSQQPGTGKATQASQQQSGQSGAASESAVALPAHSNGNGRLLSESAGEVAPSTAAEPSGPFHSPEKPAPKAGEGNLQGAGSQGEDAVVQTLAAGGTLLSPPTGPRDTDTLRGNSTGIIQPINSSEASSFQNPDGGSPSGVQSSGFQCMPPDVLAKEVAQLSWVGHGGYGAVYKGVWQGANVAVKFTVADYMDFAGASAHEAVLSKMLSHPNVVQTFASRVSLLDEEFLRSVFDGETTFPSRELPVDSFRSGEGFGSPYGINTSMRFRDVLTHIGARPGHYITQMIMEYCDRGSLHQAIAKGLFKSSSKWNNKIALRALLRTAREIAQGMSHLHACRVVHGDLKPGNVLLMSSRADRRGFTAKVSDFGLSTYCMASHTSVTRWSTVSYMAPEAFEGHLTMGSDTFSFGVLLWEMYTGQQPYAGLQAAQIVMGVQAGQLTLEWPPDSDPRIVDLVEGCIQRNPAARPSFNQLINQLTSLEAHIRLEAAPSDGASEHRMPLLGTVGSGGNMQQQAHAVLPPAAAAAADGADTLSGPVAPEPALAMLTPPLLPPEEEARLAAAHAAAAAQEPAMVMLTPPLLPPEEEAAIAAAAAHAAAAAAAQEPVMMMLTPPPLPPEEEAEVMRAAAARAAAPEDVRLAV